VPSLAVAAAALAPARADACSGVPWPTYTITSLSPNPGSSGVARDAGIIVAGVPSFQSGAVVLFADVELIDSATDEAVPLAAFAWFSLRGSDLTMAVHPAEPLEPLHAYRAEARLRGGFGNGAPFVSNFTTSDALLEPLVLSGELGLSLRGAEVDVVDSTCGVAGPVVGKRRALFADVQLPVPSGGQGVYLGVLDFSDHTPLRFNDDDPSDDGFHEIRDLQAVNIQPGQALTLEQEVFEEDFAYAGCFNFAVTDPAGHVVQTSRCLPSLSPDEVRALAHLEAPLPIAADEGVAIEEVQRAVADYREEQAPVFGCSFGANATARTRGWLSLLLAALLAARVSRRR
jgi:hypothetical protein